MKGTDRVQNEKTETEKEYLTTYVDLKFCKKPLRINSH